MSRDVEYRVRYRRRWGRQTQTRFFQTEFGLRQFLRKLRAGDRPDLEPLVELEVQQRHVGPWETKGQQ